MSSLDHLTIFFANSPALIFSIVQSFKCCNLVSMHIRAGELPKNFRSWVQTRHMGLKNVPKKFGTPGPNLAPNLFGFNLIHTVLLGVPALVIWPWTNNPKRLGAKFGPGVPNFLGTFFRPICRVWIT